MITSALVLVVLAAAPAPAAKPDLVDLLDFDQGTVLVSETASFGEDLSGWAPFYLADGSVSQGWCSAQGTLGGEFVFELEQDSELSKLRISNAQTDEGNYPGISAKTVELWGAGASGAFTRIGSFEAAKGADREFPLSAKAPVRRVKVVVKGNWGNAEYTEIMELDLLGKKLGGAAKADVSGDYYSPQWSGLRMRQTGSHVDGCYDYKGGVFSGELEGRVAKVVWREFGDEGEEVARGAATFVVAPDKSKAWGIYFNEEGNLSGEWDLARPADAEQKPTCTPPDRGLAAQLKKDGRVVLYGIRFDVNSDVPRVESEPTLIQVLELLKAEKGLALQVEGHTDSTNTDAYNQDLSERRAKAVARWLTERGIAAERLAPKGFGRTKPVASNDTAQGRALNRRVEIAAIKK